MTGASVSFKYPSGSTLKYHGRVVSQSGRKSDKDVLFPLVSDRLKEVSSHFAGRIFCEILILPETLTGTYTIANDTYPSEWDLNYIRIYVQNGYQYFYPEQIEPDKDLKFTVINDDYDDDKPVIQSITIDKNGQMVKAGETVTIKVKVDEKNPSSSMRVYFYPKDSGASGIYAYLYLNKNTMEYTGSINISQNIRPAKWELTSLSLSDTITKSVSIHSHGYVSSVIKMRPLYSLVSAL